MGNVLEQQQFGIDLGTSNTLIYQGGKGIVLDEPSVITIQKDTGEIVAVGKEARAMVGWISNKLKIVYPLQDGVIANLDLVTAMLQHFFQKIKGSLKFFQRTILTISVPCNITEVTKRAMENIMIHKGVNKVILIEEPIAAALGAGLPIYE